MKALEHPDSSHFRASEGWLELGNLVEANKELDRINPDLWIHPDVLGLRCEIFGKAEEWDSVATFAEVITQLEPHRADSWIRFAFALHEMERTEEAYEVLRPVIDQFPTEWVMRYNLACYEAQRGRLKRARGWLEEAVRIGNEGEIREMALQDPDLEPLRAEIGEM